MRPSRPTAALVLAVACAAAAGATVIEVDHAGGGDFATIQEGLDAAAGGDTVLVHPGVYTGLENRALDFAGKDVALVSVAGADSTAIDCEFRDRGFCFDAGEGPGARVEGFGVRNGRADWGGGLYCVSSSPSVLNCAFEGCEAGLLGGAVYFEESSAVLEDCVFRANHSGGGALYYQGSSLRVSRCTFVENTSPSLGGGVYGATSTSVFDGCAFEANEAPLRGGAMWITMSADTIRGSTFVGNRAYDDGGAVTCRYADITVADCEFTDNHAEDDGGAVVVWQSEPRLIDCSFTGNVAESVGGAILYSEGHGDLSDCTFFDNEAGHGGAVHLYVSSPYVTDCTFRENVASSGGAVYAEYDCEPTFEGCTFVGNTADYDGGGLYVDRSTLWMTRCTLSANAAGDDGAGIRFHISSGVVMKSIIAFSSDGEGAACHGTALPTFRHCCVFANAGGDSLCGNYGENVFVNPGFCDPPDGDLSLRSDSACLPEGNLWGEAIGAHGWGCEGGAILVDAVMVDGAVAPWETAAGILLELSGVTEVTVRIYDLMGRRVASPYEREILPSGVNLISWDLTNDAGHRVACGTYFCVVEAGGSTHRSKIAVIGR